MPADSPPFSQDQKELQKFRDEINSVIFKTLYGHKPKVPPDFLENDAFPEGKFCCKSSTALCYAAQTSENLDAPILTSSLRKPVCELAEKEFPVLDPTDLYVSLFEGTSNIPNMGAEDLLIEGAHIAALLREKNAKDNEHVSIQIILDNGYNGTVFTIPLNYELPENKVGISGDLLKAFALDTPHHYFRAYYPTCAKYVDQWDADEQKRTDALHPRTVPATGKDKTPASSPIATPAENSGGM